MELFADLSDPNSILLGAAILFIQFIIIIYILIRIFRSPFSYPYKCIDIDISHKRSPKIEDLVDRYLIEHGLQDFVIHKDFVEKWKKKSQKTVMTSVLKKRRQRQLEKCIDDNNMFLFRMMRQQTRYTQQNYVKRAYRVNMVKDSYYMSYDYIVDRFYRLQEIGFECTLSEYNAKSQRKLMTKALRDKIALRDNFTCQLCGKYMPDGVGLQIDHIVPIAKGGKTVPSNLQVLCSKCNGRKSSK